MRRKKIQNLPLGILFVWVTTFLFVAIEFEGGHPAWTQAKNSNIVSGSGTSSNRVYRCIKEVVSDCGDGIVDLNGDGIDDTRIVNVVRETDLNECAPATTDPCGPSNNFMNCELVKPSSTFSQYTGLISNDPANGHQTTHTQSEGCSRPNQVSQSRFTNITTLENATVAGLTGDVEITIVGTAKGDIKVGDPNAKVITNATLTIRGTSGQLEGAMGHGLLDGESWYNGAFSNYNASIKLPN